jgi:hypothetical protein
MDYVVLILIVVFYTTLVLTKKDYFIVHETVKKTTLDSSTLNYSIAKPALTIP